MVLWFLNSGAMFRNPGQYVTVTGVKLSPFIIRGKSRGTRIGEDIHMHMYICTCKHTYTWVHIPYCVFVVITFTFPVKPKCIVTLGFFALLIYLLHQLRTKTITCSCISASWPAASIVRFFKFMPYK